LGVDWGGTSLDLLHTILPRVSVHWWCYSSRWWDETLYLHGEYQSLSRHSKCFRRHRLIVHIYHSLASGKRVSRGDLFITISEIRGNSISQKAREWWHTVSEINGGPVFHHVLRPSTWDGVDFQQGIADTSAISSVMPHHYQKLLWGCESNKFNPEMNIQARGSFIPSARVRRTLIRTPRHKNYTVLESIPMQCM